MSKSGWIYKELFSEWLQHFQQQTNSSTDNSTLLLLGNNSSHTSLAAYNFCKMNEITVMSFPPHISHWLQPLNVSVFGPLKNPYHSECSLFMRNNPYQKIEKEDIPRIVKSAYEKVSSVGKAVSGFQETEIFPLNSDVFCDEDFTPALTEAEITSVGHNDEQVRTEYCNSGCVSVEVGDCVASSSRDILPRAH
ncbi:hypothetical protein PR048_013515 [Dryococelus australis]|uniref:DDE-1 domain-containing protein n=1 Tax=Dryococelus australis TaxID=614101 RepID=A0ABQ9HSP0_9NEOP|nr:hypothetical protein PR048_013515 [Dryococelus australis]